MAFAVTVIVIALSLHFGVFCVLSLGTQQPILDHISKEDEDLELEKQLEILNKPAVKSFKSSYGDTYDCVDINKQPSLDHPLLKNHTIQMRPRFSAQRKMFNTTCSSYEPNFDIHQFTGYNCSEGTVPIRRKTKEDLSRAQSFVKNYKPVDRSSGHFFFAGLQTKNVNNKIYRGAQAFVTIHTPHLYHNSQFSAAVITIRRGTEWIIVGWMVNPALYGDKSTRAFTMWLGKGGKTVGCYNLNCPGFVQTKKSIALDHVFEIQNGVPSYTGFAVNQDEKGNWWLGLGNSFDEVGYWPKELFTDLSKGATYMELGGQVYTGEYNKYWPWMGSRVFKRDYKYNGRMFQILFMNSKYIATIPGENDDALVQLHLERCYLSKDNSFKGPEEGYSFLYAGFGAASDKCYAP